MYRRFLIVFQFGLLWITFLEQLMWLNSLLIEYASIVISLSMAGSCLQLNGMKWRWNDDEEEMTIQLQVANSEKGGEKSTVGEQVLTDEQRLQQAELDDQYAPSGINSGRSAMDLMHNWIVSSTDMEWMER